jgi:outer membrane protein
MEFPLVIIKKRRNENQPNKLLALSLALALATLLSKQAWCIPFNLRQTVEYATQHSPSVVSAKATLLITELQYKTQVGKMLPSLDFSATHGLQNNIPINIGNGLYSLNSAAPWSSALNLGVTETLYDNGNTLTQASIARLNQELASQNYRKTRETVTLDVSNEFYQLSLAIILLEVRKQQEVTVRRQFQTLTHQYQQGLKTKTDYLRLKTQVQRAELQRISAENDIQLSYTVLRKLLAVGLHNPTLFEFEPLRVQKAEKLEALLPSDKPSIDEFYDSKTFAIQNEINGKHVYLTERNYWPQVFITGGIAYSNFAYLNSGLPFNNGSQLTWNALLTFQYNIWDWGIRKRNVEVAQLNRDIQENTLTQNLLEVDAAINSLMLSIYRIQKSLILNQELLTSEEQTYHTLETQYREGKVTYLDLITGLNSLLDAKIQFYSTYFEALRNKAKHSYYKGKLYETISSS